MKEKLLAVRIFAQNESCDVESMWHLYRLYREYKGSYINDLNISVPAAVSVFPEEVYQAPRSWTERAYPNLIFYNKHNKGGHFAAWEQPEIFTSELRDGLRSLRQELAH